jgi:hypothetical protein
MTPETSPPDVECSRSTAGLIQPPGLAIRLLVVMALVSTSAFADVVHLRGGGQITGEIIEESDDSVTVDIGGGYVTARTSSIVDIERSVSPLQEFRARAQEIPADDAESWRELARWASYRALSSQAAEAYSQVLTSLPNDAEANEALGRVQLNGQWVSEEEAYRARGFIQFEGEWMTPAEKQRILADRQAQEARERAERDAIDAKVEAIEAEQKEEKRREETQREREEARRNPVAWGWGAGPRYWPYPGRRW